MIEDHLALKQRNAGLEQYMPLQQYMPTDPFDNHALFKTEEQAQIEDAETGVHPAVTQEWTTDGVDDLDQSWLDRQRCAGFDWGS